jgi:hypothetical protein
LQAAAGDLGDGSAIGDVGDGSAIVEGNRSDLRPKRMVPLQDLHPGWEGPTLVRHPCESGGPCRSCQPPNLLALGARRASVIRAPALRFPLSWGVTTHDDDDAGGMTR